MTDADVITQAEGVARQNDISSDLPLWLNRIYRGYCRKPGVNWPQLRILNATLTTVANTQSYALPAAFERPCGSSVLYDVTAVTGGHQNGRSLPILMTGDPESDARIQGYNNGGVSSEPGAVAISGAGGTGLQFVFYPAFTRGGKTVLYNYYAAPATLDGSGVTFEIQCLDEVLVNALSKEICIYSNDTRRASYFAAQERIAWKGAQATLRSQ